jgi:hypothetical protein
MDLNLLEFFRRDCYLISGIGNVERIECQQRRGEIVARTIKIYRIAEDGRRLASGAFQAVV